MNTVVVVIAIIFLFFLVGVFVGVVVVYALSARRAGRRRDDTPDLRDGRREDSGWPR